MSMEPARRAWDHRGRGPPSPPCARRSAPAHQRPRARAKQASPPSSGWEGDWAGLGTGWGPCVGWGTAWSPWTGACPGWVCGSQSFRVSLERQLVPRRSPSVKSRQCACTVLRFSSSVGLLSSPCLFLPSLAPCLSVVGLAARLGQMPQAAILQQWANFDKRRTLFADAAACILWREALLHGLRRRPPQPLPLLACKGSRRQCISTLWPRRERLASPDSTLHPPPSCRQTLEPSAGLGTAALGRQPCWPCSFTHHHLEDGMQRCGKDQTPILPPPSFCPLTAWLSAKVKTGLTRGSRSRWQGHSRLPALGSFFRSVCGSEGAWMSTRQAMGF